MNAELVSGLKERVLRMRTRGSSYGQIAVQLGVSRNTVKSLCRRAQTSPTRQADFKCGNCGVFIGSVKTGQRFCSSTCRLAWWHDHPEQLLRLATYSFTCAGCGKPFSAYGNKNRKYCTHNCYIRHRFHTSGVKP